MIRTPAAAWVALHAVIPDRAEDDVVACLADASLGAEVSHAGPGRSRLTVYVEAPADAADLLDRAAAAIAAAGLVPAECALSTEPVADGRWAEAWQASLRPFPLGARFLVVPGEPATDPAGRTALRLVPGRAFGTGEHPTTRMCAAALERGVRAGDGWLDLGSGTGILAMVAAHCGATRVAALDNDPEAVEVCREVVLANGLGSVVRCGLGSAADVAPGAFDGVVANVAASFFLRHAREVAAALRPGGVLVASGFLREDVPEIRECLDAAGLAMTDSRSDGPWALVVARKAQP